MKTDYSKVAVAPRWSEREAIKNRTYKITTTGDLDGAITEVMQGGHFTLNGETIQKMEVTTVVVRTVERIKESA